ncbi:MAG: hypothetical protein OXC82_10455 [Rhodobacteraceae bacterium]|nr:hypothetical protein [Paracoccaceae bacterium]MCY4250836.1 hypothetical protein [Paracoccaceae bacterium]
MIQFVIITEQPFIYDARNIVHRTLDRLPPIIEKNTETVWRKLLFGIACAHLFTCLNLVLKIIDPITAIQVRDNQIVGRDLAIPKFYLVNPLVMFRLWDSVIG